MEPSKSSLPHLLIGFCIFLPCCVGTQASRRGGPTAAYSGPMVHFEGPTSPLITGRSVKDGQGGVKIAWSGTSATIRFKGSAVSLELSDSGMNHYMVLIDGKAKREKVTPIRGRSVIELARGLPRAEHTVTLYKLNEAFVGTAHLHGFILDEHGQALSTPIAQGPELLVIGDSISSGYGNEGEGKECGFSPETQNHFSTYAARAARELNARLTTIAWSGKGAFTNRGSKTDTVPLPALWSKSLPVEGIEHDFRGQEPQAIVINLGSNDFAPEVKDRSPYAPAMTALIEDVRSHYAEAHLFLAIGPLLTDEYPEGFQALSTVRQSLTELAQKRLDAGDRRVHLIEFKGATPEEGYGCDWHPSLLTHSRMAATLTRLLREKAGF